LECSFVKHSHGPLGIKILQLLTSFLTFNFWGKMISPSMSKTA
jgi:hypothetical protein